MNTITQMLGIRASFRLCNVGGPVRHCRCRRRHAVLPYEPIRRMSAVATLVAHRADLDESHSGCHSERREESPDSQIRRFLPALGMTCPHLRCGRAAGSGLDPA